MAVRSYAVAAKRQNQPMKGLSTTTTSPAGASTPASVASSYKRLAGAIVDSAPLKRMSAASQHSPTFSLPSPEGGNCELKTFVYDPATDQRGRSIAVAERVPIGETLVTDIVYPRPPPDDSDKEKPEMRPMTPSELGREWRRRLEASWKLYPRNMWGPVTKWGCLVNQPLTMSQKDHFKGQHDKLQKQRLEARKFGFERHWVKYKNLTNMWEDREARQSLAYIDPRDQFKKDAERMLHAQNDQRIARTKRVDEKHRNVKRWREFNRLEKREDEYLRRIDNEAMLRKDPGWRVNFSSVNYDIVTLGYTEGHDGDKLKYQDLMFKWRQSMRALRLQSKQSGCRMYDVVTWKPQRPCRLPAPKPELPVTPTAERLPSPKKPEMARPRNMLHSMYKLEDVPIGCTNDNRTNW
ncbi:hypothetical protein AXG93_3457s1390 [Marchantia polymorpha subsp. ruderalis]|nr:hypothetical protein AXG93_3457s1390 [Marchantia polymorpha subsp. ruderalis]